MERKDEQAENRKNLKEIINLIPLKDHDPDEHYKYNSKKWKSFLKAFGIEANNLKLNQRDYSFTQRNQEFVLNVLNDYATDESMKRFKKNIWRYDDHFRFHEIFMGIMYIMMDAGKDTKTCNEQLAKIDYTVHNTYCTDLNDLKNAVKAFKYWVGRELDTEELSYTDKYFLLYKMKCEQIELIKKWTNVIKFIKDEQNCKVVELIKNSKKGVCEFYMNDPYIKSFNTVCSYIRDKLHRNNKYIEICNEVNQWKQGNQMPEEVYQRALEAKAIEEKTIHDACKEYGINEFGLNVMDTLIRNGNFCPELYEKAMKHFTK